VVERLARAQSGRADLDALVGRKVDQLAATIAALRADESELTGKPATGPRRFFPVVLATERFPVSPVTADLVRRRLAAAGTLSGADVSPLALVDLLDLELVEEFMAWPAWQIGPVHPGAVVPTVTSLG
jgi:hypothetical protein